MARMGYSEAKVGRSPNGIGDSGTERERRRDHLRLGAPSLRQRRFECVLKEVAKRWNSAVVLATDVYSRNPVNECNRNWRYRWH